MMDKITTNINKKTSIGRDTRNKEVSNTGKPYPKNTNPAMAEYKPQSMKLKSAGKMKKNDPRMS